MKPEGKMKLNTPWRTEGFGEGLVGKGFTIILKPDNYIVGIIPSSILAQEIVRRVNSHDKLVEALKQAKPFVEHSAPPKPDHICGSPDAMCDAGCTDYAAHCEVMHLIESALKAAKGESNEEK